MTLRAPFRALFLLHFPPSPSAFPRLSPSLVSFSPQRKTRWFSWSGPSWGELPGSSNVTSNREVLTQRKKNLTVELGQSFRENNLDEVIKIYQSMAPDDIKIARSKALRTVMNSYAKSKRFSEAITSFDQMFLSRRVKNDDINSFCIAIMSCAETNKFFKAKKYFEKIKWIDREGKAAISMTEACLKMNKFEAARYYFSDMINEGKMPTQRIFNSLIHKHIKADKPNDAIEFFNDMQKMGLQGDAFTYSSLMNACNQAGRPDKAFWLFEEMSKMGINADQMVYSNLLTACLKANRPEEAIKYFGEIKHHFKSQLDSKILNIMLFAYSKEKSLMEALEFGEEMIASKRISPDTSTLNTMLSFYFKAHLFDKAFQFFEDLKGQGVQPDIITFTCLLRGCVRNPNGKFEEYFQEMSKKGIKPNQRTYNTIIHACAQKGDMKKALKTLKMMEEHSSSDIFTYNSLLNVCKQLGDPIRAMHYYQELIRKNFAPDIVTFTSLLKVMINHNNHCNNGNSNSSNNYNDNNNNNTNNPNNHNNNNNNSQLPNNNNNHNTTTTTTDNNNNTDDSLTIPYVLSEMRKWGVQGNSHFCQLLEMLLRQGGYPQTLTEFLGQHGVEKEHKGKT